MKPFPWRPRMAFTRGTHSGIDDVSTAQEVVTISDGSVWLRYIEGGEEDPGHDASRRSYMEQACGWVHAALCAPDPTDPATLGALLGAVREERDEPRGFVLPPGALCDGWLYVSNADTSPLGFEGDGYPTEFAALMAAWEKA